jgi:hypothetical protein
MICGSVVLFRTCFRKSFLFEVFGVTNEEKTMWAIGQLRDMGAARGRLPKRQDFDEVTRSRIKSFLGPWPRALEAAGLKEAAGKEKPKKKR